MTVLNDNYHQATISFQSLSGHTLSHARVTYQLLIYTIMFAKQLADDNHITFNYVLYISLKNSIMPFCYNFMHVFH